MSNIAYVRVSTAEQNEQRQLELMKQYDVQKIFTEKISGKNLERPQLKLMLDYVRPGDVILVESMSRLSRSMVDLHTIIDQLMSKGVEIRFLKENLYLQIEIDSKTNKYKLDATSKLFVNMMSSIAEFERDIIKERQAEGIAIAKANGKYKGRKAVELDEDILVKWVNKELTTKYVLETFDISRQTLYNKAKEYKERPNN